MRGEEKYLQREVMPKRAAYSAQSSVAGVVSEDKPCSNDGNVGERTAPRAIPLNI
jgi:hypothetical protein